MNHEFMFNYEVGNKPYASEKNTDEIVRFLEESSCATFKCFSDNQIRQLPPNAMCY